MKFVRIIATLDNTSDIAITVIYCSGKISDVTDVIR